MKKIISILLVLTMAISIAACGKTDGGSTEEGIYKPGTYTATEPGYNKENPIEVQVTLSENKIESVEILSHGETEGIGSVAVEKLPERILETQSADVDIVSTATMSSNAILAAVKKILDENSTGKAPAATGEKTSEETAAKDYDVDVVVVGAGGAGMAAAIEASANGKSVLILEKGEMTGGNTTRATGGMNAAKTVYQDANEFDQGAKDAIEKKLATVDEKYPELKELANTVKAELASYEANPTGYFDSTNLFLLDTLVGGKNLNDYDLAKTLVENSAGAIEWLKTYGMELTDVAAFGGASVKRIHRPTENGKSVSVGAYLVPKLTAKVEEKNIEILFNTPATELIEKDGAIVGVKAGDSTINAKSVVLATGGFGANLDKVVELKPDLKGFVSTNASTITGDGIWMAEAVGADTVDMAEIQIHPTVEQKTASLITEGVRGDGAILVNQDGVRFIDEVGTRDVVSAAEIAQPGGYAYLIFDKNMVDKSGPLQGYISKGFTEEGATIEELAEKIKIDPATLAETLNTWNESVKNKKDDAFGRTSFTEEIATAPYYSIKLSPGIHHTMGGLKINTNAEVLNKEGQPIKNLYAAGEVTGGVHGGNRLGGNAVADIIIFGKIAGENAAKNAQ